MNFKHSIIATALVSTLAMSSVALADRGGHGGWRGGYGHGWGHGHGHGWGYAGALVGGAVIAGALLGPWSYPRAYYYDAYPIAVEVAPPAPIVYIEQARAAQPAVADAGAGSWWYYCNESRAYYPYVKECASPWQRVSPTPPGAR